MRILVTGSTGFVGRKLGLELVRRGHSLICLVRNPEEARHALPFPADLREWDNPGALADLDAVLHLAGEPIAGKRWSQEQKEKILKSRTETSRYVQKLAQAASGKPASVFVTASAVGFYGNRGDELLSEQSNPGADFLSEVCQKWEAAALEAKSFASRVVMLRTGIALGRDGGALPKMLPVFKAGLGGKLGNGKQWMSWIHLDDLVKLYCFALENDFVEGPLNGCAPNPVTNAEFTESMAKQLRRPAFFTAPKWGLKIALGEMSEMLLDSQRALPRAAKLGFKFRHEKLDEALSSVFKHVERARGALCHEFVSEQWIPSSAETIFALFSDPHILEALTPPSYALRLLNKNSIRLRENAIFSYRVKSWGRAVECRSHIIDWIENTRISSTHQKGPFTLWFHVKGVERIPEGTILTERILYRCRGGLLGSIVGNFFVNRKLAEIFRFRNKRLAELARGATSTAENHLAS